MNTGDPDTYLGMVAEVDQGIFGGAAVHGGGMPVATGRHCGPGSGQLCRNLAAGGRGRGHPPMMMGHGRLEQSPARRGGETVIEHTQAGR